jgi:hypothetical protein
MAGVRGRRRAQLPHVRRAGETRARAAKTTSSASEAPVRVHGSPADAAWTPDCSRASTCPRPPLVTSAAGTPSGEKTARRSPSRASAGALPWRRTDEISEGAGGGEAFEQRRRPVPVHGSLAGAPCPLGRSGAGPRQRVRSVHPLALSGRSWRRGILEAAPALAGGGRRYEQIRLRAYSIRTLKTR